MAYISFQPKDHFNTILNTGDGTTNKSFTGVGFQPDLVWNKIRSTTYSHWLYDAVRGAGAEKEISSNTTTAEGGNDNQIYGYISSFDSDGFSVTGSSNSAYFNQNNETYVNWNWKANGQGSSNTDGSINTTYTSASTTSGFSISSYNGNGNVGATVGHGLGAVPTMIIVKRLNGASDWMVYHVKIGNNYRLRLNEDAAEQDNPVWNDTTPTSSVFYMNDNGDANASGGTYVAYCFSDVKAFSKMGTYKGNGNATNPAFIYTGFKPAFVMLKVSSTTDSWNMYDNRRLGYNGTGARLRANITNAEDTGTEYQTCDFYSNGFAPRGTDTTSNGSGKIYVYMAFAEAPFVNSSGIPATARV